MSVNSELEKRLQLGSEMAEFLRDSFLTAPRKSYAQMYTLNLAMQFWSNLRAVLSLLADRFDSEAWTVGRSMVEIFIRGKWIQKRKTNAPWTVIGHELRELNRFMAHKGRSRARKQAIAALQERIDAFTSNLSKRGRFWSKKNSGVLRKEPDMNVMAKECGALKIYHGYYKLGCEHSHSSHHVLTRFMELDANRQWTGTFVLSNPPGDNLSMTSHYLLNLTFLFVMMLHKKAGWPIDATQWGTLGNRLIALRPGNLELR
jgi:uncharacterized protein DUF5677